MLNLFWCAEDSGERDLVWDSYPWFDIQSKIN